MIENNQAALFGYEVPESTLLPFQVHAKPADLPAFVEHSEESIEAARSIKSRTSAIRQDILEMLTGEELTDEQIADRLKISQNTSRPRRIELFQAGKIIDAGRTTTSSGRHATLWKAA